MFYYTLVSLVVLLVAGVIVLSGMAGGIAHIALVLVSFVLAAVIFVRSKRDSRWRQSPSSNVEPNSELSSVG